jgi:hypothetical protein
MLSLLRCLFMVGALAVVALAGMLEQPELKHDLGLEKWSLASLQSKLTGEPSYDPQHDDENRAIMRRIERKDGITKDLIAGHITLFEAAALFRDLDQEIPGSPYQSNKCIASTEERLCWEVIRWVQGRVRSPHNPHGASADFVAQLERDLRGQKAKNGLVTLPNLVTR